LTSTKVTASGRDLAVEREPVLVRVRLERKQSGRAQRIVQLRVVVLPEHVQVLPECAADQLGRLRDDGDVRPERVEVDRLRREAVVKYLAVGEDATKERQGERAFPASSPADCSPA
jgi:hypothetical protein